MAVVRVNRRKLAAFEEKIEHQEDLYGFVIRESSLRQAVDDMLEVDESPTCSVPYWLFKELHDLCLSDRVIDYNVISLLRNCHEQIVLFSIFS